MVGRRTPAIKPGELAIVCDECTGLIKGDEGFLTAVPGHDGKRRWRAYHGDCESLANVVARESRAGTGKAIVVRTGRVATYTELLATLAELARCPQMDFAGTAWPALLQRLAFDTDWQLTDGRRSAELHRENARFMAGAGFARQSSRLMTPAENERERAQRELRHDEDRRARARKLARDMAVENRTEQESIA